MGSLTGTALNKVSEGFEGMPWKLRVCLCTTTMTLRLNTRLLDGHWLVSGEAPKCPNEEW